MLTSCLEQDHLEVQTISDRRQVYHLAMARIATPNQSVDQVVFTMQEAIDVQAPAELAYSVLVDLKNYEQWNNWTHFPADKEKGEEVGVGKTLKMVCYNYGKNRPPIKMKIKILVLNQEERRIAWAGLYLPTWLVVAERVQTVEKTGEHTCRLENHESMSGWLAYLIKWVSKSTVEARAAEFVRDFKTYVETKYRETAA